MDQATINLAIILAPIWVMAIAVIIDTITK